MEEDVKQVGAGAGGGTGVVHVCEGGGAGGGAKS